MLLIAMLNADRDVLYADFYRFYRIDLWDSTLSVSRLAALAEHLPECAKIWGCLDARCAWTRMEYLLAGIYDHTKAAVVDVEHFEPLARPSAGETGVAVDGVAVSVDEFDRIMNGARVDV